LGSDETRRRYHDIITTTTPIEGGDDILYHRELNHIGLPNLGRGAIVPRVKLSRPIFYSFITRQSIVIILHLRLQGIIQLALFINRQDFGITATYRRI
jgi:hypothetical protein